MMTRGQLWLDLLQAVSLLPLLVATALGRAGREATTEVTAAARQQRLRALFEAHYDTVWRVLRSHGLQPALADDGAQQVFLVALQRLDDVREGSERAFLCATAVWVARRTRQARPTEELTEAHEPEGGARPDELSQRRRDLALLDRLLRQLSDDLRTALVLQEIEGLTKREVAEVLGIPEGTVASRVRRAREALQGLVKQLPAGEAP